MSDGKCSLGKGGVDNLLGQYEYGVSHFTQQSFVGQTFREKAKTPRSCCTPGTTT